MNVFTFHIKAFPFFPYEETFPGGWERGGWLCMADSPERTQAAWGIRHTREKKKKRHTREISLEAMVEGGGRGADEGWGRCMKGNVC